MSAPPIKPNAKHIVIIGAGPQGLATGIELLEAGHQVTVLEAEKVVGQGISRRPEHSRWGIVHSGCYYDPKSERGQLCFEMYKALEHPGALDGGTEDGTVMQLYRKNTRKVGKLIVAHDEKEMETLRIFARRLQGTDVDHILLTKREDIEALKEPILGDVSKVKGVLNLSNVRTIFINGFIEDLKKKFEEKGGRLQLSHEVIGFDPPGAFAKDIGTAVRCKTERGDTIYHADAVVNMAGLHSAPVVEKAAEALRASTQAEAEPPETPKVRYVKLSGLVPKHPEASGSQAKHLVFMAGNAVIEGANTTVGAHIYPSAPVEGAAGACTIGPFQEFDVTPEELNGPPKALTKRQQEAARKFIPEGEEGEWNLELLGRVASYVDKNNERIYARVPCADDKTGFYVLHCLTSDAPGMTAAPAIAKHTAQEVLEHLTHVEKAVGQAQGRTGAGIL